MTVIDLESRRRQQKQQKIEDIVDKEYGRLLAQGWVICDKKWEERQSNE